jgi:hypothetical protein
MSERFAAHDRLKKIWEDEMNTFKPKSKEELDAERKRFNRNKIVSAVGDGISAIANLVSAANYAPNMYNNENSLSSKMQARYDKATADYEAKKAQYMNAASNWGKIVDTDADIKYQQWADKVKNVLAQAKEKRERDNAAANLALNQQRLVTEGYKSQKAKVVADNAPTVAKDAHELSAARRDQANASTQSHQGTFCGMHYSNDKEYSEIVHVLANKYDIDTYYLEDKNGYETVKYEPLDELAGAVLIAYKREKEKNSYKRK